MLREDPVPKAANRDAISFVGQVDVVVRPYVVSAHVKVHTLLVFFALLGESKRLAS
jgi:hypothetical protein